MLTELTKEQEALIPVVTKEWTELATKGEINVADIVEGCYWLAEIADLPKPKVIITHSPYAAQVMTHRYSQPGVEIPDVVSLIGETTLPKAEEKFEFFPFSIYGNISDYAWCAYYEYFIRIGAIESTPNFDAWMKFLRAGVFDMIQLEGLFVVATRPTHIDLDDKKRLHSTTRPAIAWADGYSLYRLHGVRFSEEGWGRVVRKEYSAKDILSETNIERRMVIMKVLGESAALNPDDVTVIDVSETLGNELISVKNLIPDKTLYALRYRCPSTGELFVSFVPEEWARSKSADEAMARKHKMTRSDYLKLDVHT